MIEAPTNSQRHDAIIAHGAQLLASGRSVESVIGQLKKRGMSAVDIEDHWSDLYGRASELIRVRRRRIMTMGIIWVALGLAMFAGIFWSMIMHGKLPFILLIGAIPLTYGIYLLRLPPTEEPSIEPPRLFGRKL